ncbi:hypothetical protein P4H66_27950 [Paenibacillus dokdonensis]|uniref:Uncharacterized protein n=1 Tax=Paenibacillus dokdonensis TaxID=2567944 RepID=A0ABU6GV70_9BACL|nr:hypothetical protein [Paenibacillus dokdonensis]MEC0243649.1 hypothetical protein [Paenibacillus dokdonensis]
MAWLQGGPFLEISFLIKEVDIKLFTSKLATLPCITIIEENITEKERLFELGYLFDEEDPNSNRIHSVRFNLFVELAGKRKSELLVNRIATETLLIVFCFFWK